MTNGRFARDSSDRGDTAKQLGPITTVDIAGVTSKTRRRIALGLVASRKFRRTRDMMETTLGGDGGGKDVFLGDHSQYSQYRNNNTDQDQQTKKIKARDCEINQTRNLSKQTEYQCESVRHSSCQKSLENSARPHRLKTPIVIRKTEPKNIVRECSNMPHISLKSNLVFDVSSNRINYQELRIIL